MIPAVKWGGRIRVYWKGGSAANKSRNFSRKGELLHSDLTGKPDRAELDFISERKRKRRKETPGTEGGLSPLYGKAEPLAGKIPDPTG